MRARIKMTYYMPNAAKAAHIAIDLGATSGRVFAGRRHADILEISEIRRFSNGPVLFGNSWHWDVARLWDEIRIALSECPGRLAGIGVDTWGVDYALLGEHGELLQNPHHYRDPRNLSAMREVLERVSRNDIYRQTGIQFMPINTLYQLFAAKRDTPELLAAARKLILMPDLFHYWLTGNAVCEYTAASTTQFTDPSTRRWATSLLETLDLPHHLPGTLVEPGVLVGHVLPEVAGAKAAGTPVFAPASHDTASAVAAVAACGDTAFLSSGTWSLIGTEVAAPILSASAQQKNFTNEGGVEGTTRFLKNVMGLWMMEQCRKQWSAAGDRYEHQELMDAAARTAPLGSLVRPLVDPDDTAFLNPVSMTAAINDFCRRTDQPGPKLPSDYARVILDSLALKYRLVIRDLESITGQPITCIRVIGGGSKNRLLNQLTADATGKRVCAGPVEAAVAGNIGIQMLATGAVSSLHEMRALIDRSFPTEIFEPSDTGQWDRNAQRFQQYCEWSHA